MKKITLDQELEALLSQMKEHGGDEDSYTKMCINFETLMRAKSYHKEALFGVSKDTLALIGANLLGIALILNYERLNILGTKAIGLLPRVKI